MECLCLFFCPFMHVQQCICVARSMKCIDVCVLQLLYFSCAMFCLMKHEQKGSEVASWVCSSEKQKEWQLPKLVLCQVGGEDMSCRITSPPLEWCTHNPLNWPATSLPNRMLNYANVWVYLRWHLRMCHHFDSHFEQEMPSSTSRAWSTVYTASGNHGSVLVLLTLIISCLITMGKWWKVLILLCSPRLQSIWTRSHVLLLHWDHYSVSSLLVGEPLRQI